jgi:hypothetical protein
MASKQQKQQKDNRERIDDLKHYFGEDADEWIDEKDIMKHKVVDAWRKKATSEYPPNLCTKCNRYWSYGLTQSHKKEQFYLQTSMYGGLPCITNICKHCL